jgi:hypothetical protein
VDKMAYSEKEDNEFYDLMEEKRADIAGMKTSEEEREKLYVILEETIIRYEEGRVTYVRGIDAAVRLGHAFDNLGNSLQKIASVSGNLRESVDDLGEQVADARTQAALNRGKGNHPISFN